MLLALLFISLGLTATVSHCAAVPSAAAGKRGLAYNDVSLCGKFSSGKITWGYDWASGTTSTLFGKYQYVPMLWGAKDFGNWNKNANAAIKQGASHLLAFNEPDLSSQANMTPKDAAAAYKKYMNPFAGKARLGAPAVSNSGSAGQGLSWLKSFLSSCNGACKIDYVPIHWYDGTGNINYFKKHVKDAHAATGKPIWITEFGMWGASQAQQAKFLGDVMPWLDAQSWVERYAYFGVFEDMMIQGGKLSSIGQVYNS